MNEPNVHQGDELLTAAKIATAMDHNVQRIIEQMKNVRDEGGTWTSQELQDTLIETLHEWAKHTAGWARFITGLNRELGGRKMFTRYKIHLAPCQQERGAD